MFSFTKYDKKHVGRQDNLKFLEIQKYPFLIYSVNMYQTVRKKIIINRIFDIQHGFFFARFGINKTKIYDWGTLTKRVKYSVLKVHTIPNMETGAFSWDRGSVYYDLCITHSHILDIKFLKSDLIIMKL